MNDTPEVTICSSSKYYGAVKAIADELTERRVRVNTPRFDVDEEIVDVTPEQKMRLTREFLDKVRRSTCIYVVAEDGYTGRSVCIEIGFAAALEKPVFISESPVEAAVSALVRDVVSVEDAPAFLAGFLATEAQG
jgi:hypothetical protein